MSHAASFRDPAGSVSVTPDRVLRTVYPEGLDNLRAWLESPAVRRLVDEGRAVATTQVQANPVVVEHPRIPFISYPWEWPAAMLHAAGLLTLDIADMLLGEDLRLKDGTPLNVLFRGPAPVFIDVLSIQRRAPLDPIWWAAAQFSRTFLIPLLLHQRIGAPIHEMFLFHRDGIPPEDAVRRLPALRRWLPPDLGLVTLPSRAARFENADLYRVREARDPGEAKFILGRRFRAFRKQMEKLAPEPRASAWSAYETQCPSYTAPQREARRGFLTKTLEDIRPERVLDIGANAGEFSLLAAKAGARVVAIDSDPETVAALWRSASAAGADVLPLVVDFARPTPPAGWVGREHAGFLDRAAGHFDCVLMLAVMHHLLVSERIPLDQILEAAAGLTTRWLAIEYVGPGDPMFRRLARGREELHEWQTSAVFEECARAHFEIAGKFDSAEFRAIYLLRRKV
ncbi:MAG TPA: class I SAM-dependent methyltransferase [Bryobacteraceae bacterium]|nr:class I SAM-dependent methyltransferase [Bryobacteraceae bacterium]